MVALAGMAGKGLNCRSTSVYQDSISLFFLGLHRPRLLTGHVPLSLILASRFLPRQFAVSPVSGGFLPSLCWTLVPSSNQPKFQTSNPFAPAPSPHRREAKTGAEKKNFPMTFEWTLCGRQAAPAFLMQLRGCSYLIPSPSSPQIPFSLVRLLGTSHALAAQLRKMSGEITR